MLLQMRGKAAVIYTGYAAVGKHLYMTCKPAAVPCVLVSGPRYRSLLKANTNSLLLLVGAWRVGCREYAR
jgi:hypothetical protein